MHKDSSSMIFLRFAGLSLLAVLVVATAVAVLGMALVRSSQETVAEDAAAATSAPLRDLFAGASADANAAQLRAEARTRGDALIGAPFTGISVRDGEGTEVYAAGDASAGNGTPSGSVTNIRGGAYTITLTQDNARLESSIFRAQRTLVMLIAFAALIGFGLLQAAFRFGVRELTSGHRRLLYLYNTGDEIRSSLDLHEVVTHLARDATQLANGGYGMVALFDDATGDIMLQATYEHASGSVSHHQRSIEEWFLRRAVATNTTVMSSQPASAYRHFFGPELDGEGQLFLMCVPVSLRHRVAGVVAVMRPTSRGNFTPSEAMQVEQLAGQAVTAVEQAQLFAKVRSYADEVELSYDATLKALMAALDAKDQVTEGHCERVAKLTLNLARDMGMSEQQLVDVERGALLHDVGKIGVPDAVLKKPAALNDLEWEAMRKHPLLAGLMVSKIGFLEGATPILLYHHERYDGQGYPFGLSGERIPLEARIFSIVDAYDAMTSDRPYREAMPHDVAMTELIATSGEQFDPEVVLAFERLMATRPELRRSGQHAHSEDHDGHHEPPAGEVHAA